ncbi:MAG: PspC domain-containing protein [Clostridiales Family XIII bacterium]|jgi:phage shock protein C|nr:PspC domain-containing protein [Clostridiales Family XIII bacterium]
METERKRLFKSNTNKVFAGVCGGIGEYFGIDPTILRVIWVILVLCFGTGLLAYLIAWFVMPRRNFA